MTAEIFAALALMATAPVADGRDFGKHGAPTATLAIAGDLLGPYHAMPYRDVPLERIKTILAGADAAFANAEGSAFELKTFPGYAAAENGGGYPLYPLATVRMFKDIGIDLLSHANNHALDWGVDGMYASDQVYDAVGFAHAGTGASLDAARAPSYFNSGKVKIGLVGAASTFSGMSPAGNPIRGAGPRPGLNPLHTKLVTCVTKGELPALQNIARRGGWQGFDLPSEANSSAFVGETEYRLCDRPGISYEVSSEDEKAIVKEVAEAAQSSDLVLFSIHAHETQSGGYDDPAPASFLTPLFHSLIDQGADVVVRHGPHIPLGIEVYNGRPIFYGMASLFFDLPAQLTVASEGPEQAKQVVKLPRGWWDSMIATVQFREGVLAAVTIYPVLIESGEGEQRGLPRLATGRDAQRILELVRERSSVFGTQVQIRGDVATLVLPPAAR